jgi:tetratricopeptide (TPR) repeat protein
MNAITALKFAAVRDPRNADIQNYIGYAYRRLSQLGPAVGHFQQALLLNPRHRGAHEHLGELLLALNEPTQAEEHLAALKQICLIPCEEFGRLRQAIAADRSDSTR